MPLPAPVIFLPGIMGSALRDEYPVDPENVWSVLKAATKSYERITLHPDDPRFEVKEPARVVRDQVFALFYNEIIEELRHNLTQDPDAPVPVYPFAYDWRQPLAITQAQLAAFIEEVIARTSLLRHYFSDGYTAATGRVNLVGHSMGGLVIAGYLATHGLGRVDKIATIASPFRGSIEAIAKTAMGTGGFSLGSGGSREREAARMTPALYHLLPSFDHAILPEARDIFLPENWQPGILSTLATFVARYSVIPNNSAAQAGALLKAFLDEAWAHRTSIESLKLSDPKRWLCIAGVGGETRLNVTITNDADGNPFFTLGEETNTWTEGAPTIDTGDNTVPYLGSRCSFIPVEQVVCLSPDDFGFFEFGDKLISQLGFHSALPTMNLAQRLVTSHLLGAPQGKLSGHPSPEIAAKDWDPPVPM